MNLLSRLRNLQKMKNQSAAAHVNEIQEIELKLQGAGRAPSEEGLMASMLDGLPGECSAAAEALKASLSDSAMQDIAMHLILKESALPERARRAPGETALAAREARACHCFCKRGHIRRSCRKFLRDQGERGRQNGLTKTFGRRMAAFRRIFPDIPMPFPCLSPKFLENGCA